MTISGVNIRRTISSSGSGYSFDDSTRRASSSAPAYRMVQGRFRRPLSPRSDWRAPTDAEADRWLHELHANVQDS